MGQPFLLVVALYVREGSEREQCHLLGSHSLSVTSLSFPTRGLCPFRCWFPGVWVCVCSRTPWALLQTLLWDWEFLTPPQPPQLFIARGFESLVSCTETLGFVVCLSLYLFFSASPCANVGPPTPSPCHTSSAPSCLSPPHLPLWMNVSLIPWLSDFHSVWFSGSSGCFCFSINCYPSFHCVRKWSISTYPCILAWTLKSVVCKDYNTFCPP